MKERFGEEDIRVFDRWLNRLSPKRDFYEQTIEESKRLIEESKALLKKTQNPWFRPEEWMKR